jgi:5-methylcytosine-specific restriction enzyme A
VQAGTGSATGSGNAVQRGRPARGNSLRSGPSLRELPRQRHQEWGILAIRSEDDYAIAGNFAADLSFRNYDSVRSKLYNLQYLDTDGKKGRPNVGESTEAAWKEFDQDTGRVAEEAVRIRAAYADALATTERVLDDDYETDESAIVVAAHRRRERDPKLAKRKRDQVERRTGKLACEACGFDSEAEWGVKGIVECHHVKAVSELEPGETTKLRDVRLLCPNCHRLVHSSRPWLS